MKILIIQPSLPDYRIPFFEALAEEVGKEITVLHFGRFKNVQHPLLKEKVGETYRIGSLRWIRDLRREVQDYSITIQVFDPHFINLFFMPFFGRKRKTILWGHGLGNSSVVNRIRKVIFKKANAIITYSNTGKDQIVNLGVPSEKVYVAHNTLKVKNSQNSTGDSSKCFLYVGRLQRRKKLDVFLEIFHNLSLGDMGYSFLIVGDGDEEKAYLQTIVEGFHLSSYVQFVPGTFDEKELLEYFKHSMYSISPGDVGLGVLHSFAYGVPVLTMKANGHGPEIENIINDKNGVVFQDKQEFEENLMHYLDETIARQMGNNAFEHYTNHANIQNMVAGFIAAINSTV